MKKKYDSYKEIRCLNCGKRWFKYNDYKNDVICNCNPDSEYPSIVPKRIILTVHEKRI